MPPADIPFVTAITGVYNGERFLASAIESILAQTLTNFEYIIIDDGSTDDTSKIISTYASQDDRIRFLRNHTNLGANGALNRGLALARAPYVAILDGDDLAYPSRFAEQVHFLEQNPDVGVVGCAVDVIDETGRYLYRDAPNGDPAQVRWEMLFSCDITHSTACMRRELLSRVGGYSRHHRYATEYELFWRLLDLTKIANLPACLGAYRLSDAQMSYALRGLQHGEVILMQFSIYRQKLGVDVGLEQIDALYRAVRGNRLKDESQVRQAANLLMELCQTYLRWLGADLNARRYVRQDCAFKAFKIAHRNRRLSESLCSDVIQLALVLDPELIDRPYVQSFLQDWPATD